MKETNHIHLNTAIDVDVYKIAKKKAIDLDMPIKEYVEVALKEKNKGIKN